ncbi:hypothetical protein LPTSP4_36150 [Leptospira ryugenii]|uniref:Lipoprotein n=1 Tax=Leptospira ryugenii TaxID=1917863 RepID=A0A2P2E5C9_9LEPT|nr:hypothetical protein LPTSP4_36150 [Leptospira ryugenii]
MFKFTLGLAVTLVVFGTTNVSANPGQAGINPTLFWVPAKTATNPTARPCDVVCSSVNLGAVLSGVYVDASNPSAKHAFHICGTDNATNTGIRPGYNIPTHSMFGNTCGIGYAGKEVFASDYSCLCSSVPVRPFPQ